MSQWKWILGMLAVVVTSVTVHAAAAEEYYIVKIKGLDKQLETTSMSAAEYKALDAAVKLEQKFFTAAVAEAAKEWRADELNKGVPFMGNKLAPRTIMMATKYSSSEKASEALTKIEEMQAKKEEREFKSKKRTNKSKEQSQQESDILTAAALVKPKLDAMISKAGGNAADAKGAAAGVAAPGGAKVNAAAEKVAK
ncbi:MAG: hypothetical protein WCI95_10985 [bacterium]